MSFGYSKIILYMDKYIAQNKPKMWRVKFKIFFSFYKSELV